MKRVLIKLVGKDVEFPVDEWWLFAGDQLNLTVGGKEVSLLIESFDELTVPTPKAQATDACECGQAALGQGKGLPGHSSYCPWRKS